MNICIIDKEVSLIYNQIEVKNFRFKLLDKGLIMATDLQKVSEYNKNVN